MDEVDDAVLEQLRADLRPPRAFKPHNKAHQASVEYLDRLGVRDLVHGTPAAEEVLAVLRAPRVRAVVEVGLITRTPRARIEMELRRHGATVPSAAIERFERWFWAISNFDRVSLRTLLEIRARRRATRGLQSEEERKVAVRMSRADPRIFAASLDWSPASWVLALRALGHSVGTVPVDKVLDEVRSHSALRALEAVLRGDPGDESRALAFASVLKAAHELHRELVPADAALRERLAQVVLRTDATPIPLVHEITGGHHSVDAYAGRHEQVAELDGES